MDKPVLLFIAHLQSGARPFRMLQAQRYRRAGQKFLPLCLDGRALLLASVEALSAALVFAYASHIHSCQVNYKDTTTPWEFNPEYSH